MFVLQELDAVVDLALQLADFGVDEASV